MTLSTEAGPDVAAAVTALRSSLRGAVLLAGDEAYDTSRRVWNAVVDRQPALIARPLDAADTATAVQVAREHGLPLSVRGGGHDWAGRAVRDGGLLIDLSGQRDIHVDLRTRIATVGGGTRAGEAADAGAAHGLVPVTGTVRQVGLAGITQGGGYGPFCGTYGMVLDNLVGADVVLADGSRVTASADEHPDLFWAIRGGGGNFGVLTSMRYQLHPLAKMLAGMIVFPLTEAASVLRGLRDVLAGAPDELTVIAAFFAGADGTAVAALLPIWSGDLTAGEPWLDRLRGLGHPAVVQLSAMDLPGMLAILTQFVADGRHNETRTRWLPTLTDTAVDTLVAAAGAMTSPYQVIAVHQFHGAASRVPVGATAWALRQDHLLIEIISTWEPDGTAGRPHRQWARDLSAALAPLALPGGYPNLLGPDEADRLPAAYGPNLPKLRDVKRRYDPDGIFTAIAALPPVP